MYPGCMFGPQGGGYRDFFTFKAFKECLPHFKCSFIYLFIYLFCSPSFVIGNLKCHYDQILDIHFFTFLYTIGLS